MRSRRSARAFGLRLAVACLSILGLVVTGAGAAGAAAPGSQDRERVIVVFRDGVSPRDVATDLAERHGAELTGVFEHSLRGFAAQLSPTALAAVRRDPRVAYVETDHIVRTFAQEVPTGIERIYAAANPVIGIDGADDLRVDVDVAIIDTGIAEHPDLNIVGGVNCSGGSPFRGSCSEGGFGDGNGHGTHVAGTVGAIDNGLGVVGVAPGARLHGVKVLGDNGSGYMSWIIAGIDWVTANAGTIDVANMSLGCECSSRAQDTAIANSVAAGVVYAVAAGNSDKDAATFSPANHPDVITVSALADFDGQPGGIAAPTCREDEDDTLANFSNFGSLIEIAAPGVCTLSTWNDGGYSTISGTSMASPHVAGAAALLASGANDPTTKADVDAIRSQLVANGNFDWTDDSGDGVTEPLLDVTGFAPAMVPGSGGEPGNSPPTASFTSICDELACSFDGSASADSDGTIVSYSWDFGDGGSDSGVTAEHTYATDGTYTVTLTVTDDDGDSDQHSASVTVGSGAGVSIELTAVGYTVRGVQHADLSWSGATSGDVDVYRDGGKIATTPNDGAYTDNLRRRRGGPYTYTVCEAGTATCSNEAIVSF